MKSPRETFPRKSAIVRATPVSLLIALIWFLSFAARERSQEQTLRLETKLVSVPVVVQNKRGEFVAGLSASDFEVREDGKIQQIEFFSTEETQLLSRPLAVVFALDSSGSAAQTIRQQRAAADAFLRQLSPSQLVAVTRFSTSADTLVDFTADRQSIEDAFARHVQLHGETAIFDGVMYAIQKLSSLTKENADRRRIVILISDGLDNSSFTRAKDVIETAVEQDVSVYVIYLPLYAPGLGGHLEARKTAPGFAGLALQTGGQFFQVGDVQSALDPSHTADLSLIFAKIVQELRSQYYIGYYPADTNFHDEYRKIRVRVRTPGGRVRQIKLGYRASPGRGTNGSHKY